MKRLLVALALSTCAALYAQEPSSISKADYSTPKSGGAPIASGGGGAVISDTIWDAAGDLAVGTGPDTAARLPKGTDGKVLTMTAGAVGWAALPAAGGAVNLQGSSPGTPDTGNFNITGVGTSTHDNIHATLTPGLFLSNTQAALVGQQQEYSPSLKLCGSGWNVGGAAAETDCWQMLARPIAGSPSSVDLVFQSSLAGAAYTQQMYMQSNGHLTIGNSGTTNGALSFLNDTSGSILLIPPAGQALGSKTITLPIANGTMALLESPALTTPSVGNGITGPGTIAFLEDADNGTNKITVTGPALLSADRIYSIPNIVSDGTFAVSPTAYPGLPRDITRSMTLFDELCGRGANQGATAFTTVGGLSVVGAGAVSGLTNPQITADGSHPCVIALTTGTSATGVASLVASGSAFNADSTDDITFDGGEIFETMVYVDGPANNGAGASDVTNTWKLRAGFFDTNGAVAGDGAYVYWDNNADTHWGCEADEGGARTSTLSNVAVTTGAWHRIRIVNSAATDTSVSYFVDGTELSCSPNVTTARIPEAVTEGMHAGVSVQATLGCSSAVWANAANCAVGIDYVYVYDPFPAAR